MIQEAVKDSNLWVQGAAFIVAVLGLGGFVWSSLKGLSWKLDKDMPPGDRRHRIKFWASWLMGPFLGLLFYAMGFLPVPGPAWAGWIGAPVMGLIGSFIAGWRHSRTKAKAKAAEE